MASNGAITFAIAGQNVTMKTKIRIFLLCFFTLVLAYSLWNLWGIFRGYQEVNDHYQEIEQYVTVSENHSNINSIPETTPLSIEDAAPPEEPVDLSIWPQVDFEQLSQINPDIVGWIFIEGTNINYPVVQADDNCYYLNRLFDGTSNGAGCIFLDYRSSPDLTDQHSIIYGHRMKDGSMFGSLLQYKKQEFYDAHSVALLVTPDAYYKIQFFSGYVSDILGDAWELGFDENSFSSWLTDIQDRSCFNASSFPSAENRIITLSTCSYEFYAAKFILHGYISQMVEKQ